MNAVLLWALPTGWSQFELLAPDLDERVEGEMRKRFRGTGVDGDAVDRLIATQMRSLREFAQDGVVLLATRAEEAGGEGDPPPGLSLTLALANRPGSATAGDDLNSGGVADAPEPSVGATTLLSGATPLLLDDPEMTAFTTEAHLAVLAPGVEKPLTRFQAQAFVMPLGQLGMAVITVTTFDPNRESDAREAVRSFANTLCFVTADGSGRSPDLEGEE